MKTLNLTEDDFGVDLSAFPESDTEETNSQSESWTTSSGSQFAGIIKKMELGTWIEFVNTDNGEHYSGKLSWKCDVTEEFTFVDHTYKVVADLNYPQLLEAFEKGHAEIVEDVPLFDRALNAVFVDVKPA